ncbi:MAG: TIGR01777 family oxidoreductase, partial [Melioribacteraceae bacterium]
TRSVDKAKLVIPNAVEYVAWNYEQDDWKKKLDGKDAVIHLAGENVMAKRWNVEHKKNIYNSRVATTRSLVRAIENVKDKPNVLISASAVGYYGNSEEPVTEESKHGKDFLANVVRDWEKETEEISRHGVRRVNIRTGIVLDKHEGALARMITPYKFFIGGPLGFGKQWFPWIHIDDVAGIFLFALDNKDVHGILNAVSPNPLRMNEFCKTLGAVMHRPSLFNVPAFVLKIIFGEGAEVLLSGANVIPERTIEYGYKFNFVDAEKALKNLLEK